MLTTFQRETIVSKLKLPESPRWHEDAFFFVDIVGRRIYRYDEESGANIVAVVEERPSGLGWAPNGDILVVSQLDHKLLRIHDSTISVVCDYTELLEKYAEAYPASASGGERAGWLTSSGSGKREITPNDMVVTEDGTAFISSFDHENLDMPTPLIRVRPDGTAEVADGNLRQPNGLLLTPSCDQLFVAERAGDKIVSYTLGDNGEIDNRSDWATLETGGDGICLDAEGAVWAALPDSHACVRVLKGGEVTNRIEFEEDDHPLACGLGGANRTSLHCAIVKKIDLIGHTTPGRVERVIVDVPGVGFP